MRRSCPTCSATASARFVTAAYAVFPDGTELQAMGAFKEDTLNARVFAMNNAEALKIMDRAGWK